LGGGVSANSLIRKMFLDNGKKYKVKVYLPSATFCTDNAAMIGTVACYKILKNKNKSVFKIILPKPSLELENW